MLTVIIPEREGFDENIEEFVLLSPSFKFQIEHSLVSIAKWEAITKKAFLGKRKKTAEETIEYVRCMTVSQNVKSEAYHYLTDKNIEEITNYINEPMTASILPSQNRSSGRDTVTSELIYYWMISMNIPFECQKWHLNRLLTLIQVCNMKTNPSKKMGRSELHARHKAINDARRTQFNSKG